MRKKPLCEKCCDKNYSKSPAEVNELVAMVGGGGASHIHCVSLWGVMNNKIYSALISIQKGTESMPI